MQIKMDVSGVYFSAKLIGELKHCITLFASERYGEFKSRVK